MTDTTTPSIRTAIIGYGLSAQVFHLPFVSQLPHFSLNAISTGSRQSQAKLSYPKAEVFSTPEALLDAQAYDLVIITSPNTSHHRWAKAALEVGSAVLVEKPFVVDPEHGEELIELAKTKGLSLSVFHNRRWDGDFLSLKSLIANQELGPIRVFESYFDRYRPDVGDNWRELAQPGGGNWIDLGAHLLDQALTLFGRPEALDARCRSMRARAQCTDFFRVSLYYPEHEVILGGGPFVSGPRVRFDLRGEEGRYLKYGLDPQESRLKQGHPLRGLGVEAPEAYGHIYRGDNLNGERVPSHPGNYQKFFEELALSINQKAPPPVSGEEALEVIKLLALAERSSDLGRRLWL